MKRARDWNPAQASLMPTSPREWLKEDHLVYFLLDMVPTLDLSEIDRVIQSKDGRGIRPYSARMVVVLLLYGYCAGKVSSGKELPDGLRTKSERMKRIHEAKAAMEADAALTKALNKKAQAEKSAAKAEKQEGQDAASRPTRTASPSPMFSATSPTLTAT